MLIVIVCNLRRICAHIKNTLRDQQFEMGEAVTNLSEFVLSAWHGAKAVDAPLVRVGAASQFRETPQSAPDTCRWSSFDEQFTTGSTRNHETRMSQWTVAFGFGAGISCVRPAMRASQSDCTGHNRQGANGCISCTEIHDGLRVCASVALSVRNVASSHKRFMFGVEPGHPSSPR